MTALPSVLECRTLGCLGHLVDHCKGRRMTGDDRHRRCVAGWWRCDDCNGYGQAPSGRWVQGARASR